MKNFIGIYDNALSDVLCKTIIDTFDSSPHVEPGRTGQGVDTSKKISRDITISNHSDWRAIEQQIAEITVDHLTQYVRDYPFLLAGAISLSVPGPDGRPMTITADMIRDLAPQNRAGLTQAVFRLGPIICQKYDRNKGGYFHWHSEFYPPPHDPDLDALHRVLLFMYYLNDVEEGGQTGFYYQDMEVSPRRGRMVIAPAGFTHTHCGKMPVSDDKYILTSWILYKRREDLYGLTK